MCGCKTLLICGTLLTLPLSAGCGSSAPGSLTEQLEVTRYQLQKLKQERKRRRAQDDREREAIAAIEKLGGVVELNEHEHVVAVEFRGPNNLIVRRLEQLPHVTRVTLNGTFDDHCLGSLTRTPGIERLSVRSGQFSDTGLAYLEDVTALRFVEFDVGAFTDTGVSHLTHLPNLQQVRLPGEFSDEAFGQWLSLGSMKRLHVRFRLNADTLHEVNDLKNIESLHLVGDYLPETLRGLRSLKWLVLEGRYDESQAAALADLLPDCAVRIQRAGAS